MSRVLRLNQIIKTISSDFMCAIDYVPNDGVDRTMYFQILEWCNFLTTIGSITTHYSWYNRFQHRLSININSDRKIIFNIEEWKEYNNYIDYMKRKNETIRVMGAISSVIRQQKRDYLEDVWNKAKEVEQDNILQFLQR